MLARPRACAAAGLNHLSAGISIAAELSYARAIEALEQVAAEILPRLRDGD